MDRNEVENRLRSLVGSHLNIDPERVVLTSVLEDLARDSMQTVELICRVEREFGKILPNSFLQPTLTFAELLNGVVLLNGVA